MAQRVAVIGAGPGGLVSARWLLAHGFEPTLFEQAPTLGGQWTGLPGTSGVWPAMYTNTSRILTAFSDLAHDGDETFLANADVLAYLQRYAEMFGLDDRIRLHSRVSQVRRSGTDAQEPWIVEHDGTAEAFDKVVVASGRFQTPEMAPMPGLDTFTGAHGAVATYHFRNSDDYRDSRVLVAGCAVSALEIASELARRGEAR
ncbi:dimethylaniline monooxygenase, partial [Mycobacterium sp. ITM-2017-0098]